jgi:RNA polymerase sigma-70 factor (ECF subfamily)
MTVLYAGSALEFGMDIASASDEALFASIAGGDERAFAEIVDRHLQKVATIAARMLNNQAEAEDVAQEAMLKVWTRASLWQPGMAKFSTWLYRVTMNLCIDRMRRDRVKKVEIAETLVDEQADPGRDLERFQLKEAVSRALDALPPRQKAAIVLCHYEGFSGKEAAQTLGVSVLAVQSLLLRARVSLRETLATYAPLMGGTHEEA